MSRQRVMIQNYLLRYNYLLIYLLVYVLLILQESMDKIMRSKASSIHTYLGSFMIEYHSKLMLYIRDMVPFGLINNAEDPKDRIYWQSRKKVRYGFSYHFGQLQCGQEKSKEGKEVDVNSPDIFATSDIIKIGTTELMDGDMKFQLSKTFFKMIPHLRDSVTRNFGGINLEYDATINQYPLFAFIDFLCIQLNCIGIVSRHSNVYGILNFKRGTEDICPSIDSIFPKWLLEHYFPTLRDNKCENCNRTLPGKQKQKCFLLLCVLTLFICLFFYYYR